MSNNLIVLLLGIFYSCLLHIARSMQRHGIHSFDKVRNHLRGREQEANAFSGHHIYIWGLLLSNIGVIFVMLAGMFGTISYFTAMYGVGMVPMLLFSSLVMKVKSGLQRWIGVMFIIAGCFFMGISASSSSAAMMTQVKQANILYILIFMAAVSPVLIIIGKRSKHLALDAMTAGLTAGMIACLDPILKSIGQNFSAANRLLPSHPEGWFYFALSFAASTSSLLITQYAYSRRVFASQLLPYFNVSYITLPVLIQWIIIPDYQPGKFEIYGIIAIIIGILIFSEKELRVFNKKNE